MKQILKQGILLVTATAFSLSPTAYGSGIPYPQAAKKTTTTKKASSNTKTTSTATKKVPIATNTNKQSTVSNPVEVAVCDTVATGNFMYYKKNTPIGKVISEYGASEISQGHRGDRYVDYSQIVLPARIARVAKGEYARDIKKVQSILSNDLIGYFGLGRRLDTPLKRKAFPSDPDYKWFVEEFDIVRNQLNQHVFFAAMPISSEYDLSTGSFSVQLPYYKDKSHKPWVKPSANQLAEDMFLSPVNKVVNNSNIKLEVDEATALKIEGQECSLVLMGHLSPELADLKFDDYTARDAIMFLPFEWYVVRDSDGEVISKMNLQSNEDSIVSSVDNDAESNEQLIYYVYNVFVFSSSEASPEKFFGPKALKKLEEAYDMDCDGGCYGFWDLGLDLGDVGPGETRIVSVVPESNGWYKVTFKQAGFDGDSRIQVNNGIITDYESGRIHDSLDSEIRGHIYYEDESEALLTPEDCQFSYEGRIGNDPIEFYYLTNMELDNGIMIMGFYKNKNTGKVGNFNGERTHNGHLELQVLSGGGSDEIILDTQSSDYSLHGTYKPETGDTSYEVHLREMTY